MKNASPIDDTALETEESLVLKAQDAVNQCRWVVGECAAKWTRRYARGRTDADFGALVGMSGDQIFQRRRVWETFANARDGFSQLKWSHFYSALVWDDAIECLQWAEELQATVAEMKAWRRAQRGEDLSADPLAEESDDSMVRTAPWGTVPVQNPSGFGGGSGESRGPTHAGEESNPAFIGVARQLDPLDPGYAPYRQGAVHPASADGSADAVSNAVERPSAHQLVKRMTSTLERCVKVLTPEFARDFHELPEPVRRRLTDVVDELSRSVARLAQ